MQPQKLVIVDALSTALMEAPDDLSVILAGSDGVCRFLADARPIYRHSGVSLDRYLLRCDLWTVSSSCGVYGTLREGLLAGTFVYRTTLWGT
jgi:hypothetical protein